MSMLYKIMILFPLFNPADCTECFFSQISQISQMNARFARTLSLTL
jgi:hypothetical protein